MATIVHSQPTVHSQPIDICINKNTETDFNSTLLYDRTLFSSHTVNTLIDLEDNSLNNNQTNNNKVTNDTANNTNICRIELPTQSL